MKKYKVLKNYNYVAMGNRIRTVKEGSELEEFEDTKMYGVVKHNICVPLISERIILANPEYFEEVKEEKLKPLFTITRHPHTSDELIISSIGLQILQKGGELEGDALKIKVENPKPDIDELLKQIEVRYFGFGKKNNLPPTLNLNKIGYADSGDIYSEAITGNVFKVTSLLDAKEKSHEERVKEKLIEFTNEVKENMLRAAGFTLLSDKEKEIIDNYRRAKEAGMKIRHMVFVDSGIICSEELIITKSES